jgi:H/ACA ribonucleoprotein complex subunit 4
MATAAQGTISALQKSGEYLIKSETTKPQLDTSQWPLLLKNYDKLLVRTSHFTPIPMGSSPLKRDIQSYVRSVFISIYLSPARFQEYIMVITVERILANGLFALFYCYV